MANNPYVNKVQLADGTPLIDISDTTATADKILQGYTAYSASGQKITGTATGGGHLTQDQDGFLVIPPDGSGGGGGSSDFSTATLTMVGDAVVNGSFYGYIGQDEYAVVYNTQMVGPYVEDNKFPIVLYKGKALIQVLDETVASYSGDITSVGNNYFFITGDCTITIS